MGFSDRRSFWGLIGAQALNAFNDTCFKSFLIFRILNPERAGAGESQLASAGEARLTIGASVLFILPFILFSNYAGHIADRFSKRSVTVGVKVLEVAIMAVGVLAFLWGNIYLLIGILFLLAAQSAFFSPAKYGMLPEMLRTEELPRANGILELTTFAAIIGGTIAAGALYAPLMGHLYLAGLILMALAAAGLALSLLIRRIPAAAPHQPLRLNPIPEVANCFRFILGDRTLRLTALGIAYFWTLAALVDLTLYFYGLYLMELDTGDVGTMRGCLVIGIGVGSWLAGHLSREKAELGLVPIGSLGMGLFSILLFWTHADFTLTLICLSFLGLAGGFFIVPLNVLLQQEAPAAEKGRVIAGVNIITFTGILAGMGFLWVLLEVVRLESDGVVLVLGGATIIATFYVFSILPRAFFRFSFWLVTNLVYRIRLIGRENLPLHGPALLVSNHVSFVDGLLLLASTHRFIRFIVYKAYSEIPGARWLARVLRIIPISAEEGPRQLVASLREASAALEKGELVCIFAEGEISRTGQLLPFRTGVERILKGQPAPVIPVYLDRIWGSIFSFRGRRFLWKWPSRIPYPVTISFGKPLPPETSVQEIRQAVMDLGSEAFRLRKQGKRPLPWELVRHCRRHPFQLAALDSTGARASRMRFLAGAIFLARQFARLYRDEPMAGMLLPPSVGAAAANVAASLLGKPVVNFNYTAGAESLRAAARQCGIKKVLTSRAFLEKFPVEVPGEAVYIEDLRREATFPRRAAAAIAAWAFPAPLLRRWIGARPASVDDAVTVIFSSGSTGDPKGVELTHFNIGSNIQALAQVFDFSHRDNLLGILPFFHSTGYTIGLWTPLLVGFAVTYHPNPLDAKVVGHLARTHRATMLAATPTFLQNYTRRCDPGDFGSLRYVVAGAEKLTAAIREGFVEKFGLEALEGYGATECSPMISVNVPDFRGPGIRQVGSKPGIGHPLPGVTVRIVDPETFEPRKAGEEGMLLVKGSNVMKGYLDRPDLTAEVMRDGWYITGDIAAMDDDGFLTLTDRLSRFAKIGGEMVPHMKVEETLHDLLEAKEQVLAVTSVPDASKGERLAVIHTLPDDALARLIERLPDSGLPNLWIPRRDAFVRADAIPVLGTGKLDLRKIRQLACEKLGIQVE